MLINKKQAAYFYKCGLDVTIIDLDGVSVTWNRHKDKLFPFDTLLSEFYKDNDIFSFSTYKLMCIVPPFKFKTLN